MKTLLIYAAVTMFCMWGAIVCAKGIRIPSWLGTAIILGMFAAAVFETATSYSAF